MDALIALVFVFIVVMLAYKVVLWLWYQRRKIAALIVFIAAFIGLLIFFAAQEVNPTLGLIVGIAGCAVGAFRLTRRVMTRSAAASTPPMRR